MGDGARYVGRAGGGRVDDADGGRDGGGALRRQERSRRAGPLRTGDAGDRDLQPDAGSGERRRQRSLFHVVSAARRRRYRLRSGRSNGGEGPTKAEGALGGWVTLTRRLVWCSRSRARRRRRALGGGCARGYSG